MLIDKLKKQYEQFADCIRALSDEEFTSAPTGKWTPGQQLDHLIRSVSPLNKVMQSRTIIESFGRSEQSSRNYDSVVVFYQNALAQGGKASGKFLPDEITSEQKATLIKRLISEVNQLCELLGDYSEVDLEQLVIPHPLLGNLTIREMVHFSTYHARHHEIGIMKLIP